MDVQCVRGSSMVRRLLGKVSSKTRKVSIIDLDNKSIGNKCAGEAVAAMLDWSASTLTRLQLRCARTDQYFVLPELTAYVYSF